MSNLKQNMTVKTMTYNVWCRKPDADRIDRVVSIIKKNMPDTLGVQEATPLWMEILSACLPEYAWVGVGRMGEGKDEHMAVFFRKDRYTLLETGTKWLSDTPDEISKYAESGCFRVMTYAVLERKADKKKFVHVNTHLDFGVAQEKQAVVLTQLIEPLKRYPLLLTGDFNCAAGTIPFESIRNSGLTPSYEFIDPSLNVPTYHGFKNVYGDQYIIDVCFLTAETVKVQDYHVCNEQMDGDYPSDHYPVLTEFVLP